MKIKLDHINLTVANLQESVDWYKKIFGFNLVESGVSPRGVKWGIVASDDSMICMSEFSGRASADRGLDGSAHRIYHFGIRVSDREQWQQTIQENQLKVSYGGEVEYPSSSSWYIHDPSGHEIEVSHSQHAELQFPKRGA